MDDMADMADDEARPIVGRHAALLGNVLRRAEDVEDRLVGLLERHADEWKEFLRSLGADSFVKKWVRSDRWP